MRSGLGALPRHCKWLWRAQGVVPTHSQGKAAPGSSLWTVFPVLCAAAVMAAVLYGSAGLCLAQVGSGRQHVWGKVRAGHACCHLMPAARRSQVAGVRVCTLASS